MIKILYVILSILHLSFSNYINNTYLDSLEGYLNDLSSNNVIIQNTESTINTDASGDSSETYHTVDYYFNLLPTEVKNAFYKDDWTYKKVDYSLSEKFYNNKKQVYAITDFDNHIIYVDQSDDSNRTILHEIGHRFEYESYVKGVNSKEFKELYDNHFAEWYLQYGGHIYNYTTEKEAYAQCFEIYFLNRNCLDQDTRKFMSSEIDSIKKSIR